MIRASRVFPVTDSSHVAEARRETAQCAEALRMNATMVGKAALAATELATNLVKHGGGGSLIIASDYARPNVLILIAIDKGRGIANLGAALRDGFSTAGSPGTGLGAIRRAASSFDVYTHEGKGTAVLCTIGEDERLPAAAEPSRITIGGVCFPKSGETESGDAWAAVTTRDVVTIAVADGLGHGPAAATASSAFVRIIRESPGLQIEELLQRGHDALRPTRGAAAAIARIYPGQGRLDFAGIGNIAGTIASDDASRKVVSLSGIVGHEMRKVQTFSYPWSASAMFVMQSDGVSASWNPDHYPGLSQHDPVLVAAVLYRDYCRGNDDATVVVAKAS